MQNKRDDSLPVSSGNPDAMHLSVVAELSSILERIRESRRPIESAIADKARAEDTTADNVIVLADITSATRGKMPTLR